jgi:hypothetical protein
VVPGLERQSADSDARAILSLIKQHLGEPYFKSASALLYHGDCVELLGRVRRPILILPWSAPMHLVSAICAHVW